jgi:hypothetical protein
MKKLILSIFLFSMLSGCTNNYIDRIKAMSDFVVDNDWEFMKNNELNLRDSYIIFKNETNAYSEISFWVDKIGITDNIIINYHFKRIKQGTGFEILYFSNTDTLCHFYSNEIDSFYFGKYFYLFEIERIANNNFRPDSKQILFYYANRDSLIKERGNNLQPLPELD